MSRFKARLLFWPTYAWNILLGRILHLRRWWDEIEPGLWLGARPTRADVNQLASLGVKAVVNLCQEFRGPLQAYRARGIDELWLPTIDFTPPTLEDIRRGVEFIRHHRAQGKGVYVHCKAGRGRSATLVLCWLMEEHGCSPAEAQALMAARRPHVKLDLDRRDVVRQWAHEFQQKATRRLPECLPVSQAGRPE
jgi:atypical dual specificity phosphatase